MCNKGYENFKAWMLVQFNKTELADMCRYGAQNDFWGLTYYSETLALYDQFHADIWSAVDDDCEALGYKSIPEFIANFRGGRVGDDEYKSSLVRYVAEKIAIELTEGKYSRVNEYANYSEDDE